jgi:peptide/nickel transport system permease protein
MPLVLKLIAQRVSLGVLMLLAASAIIFLGVELLPGNIAEVILGQSATPEAVANLTREFGLDRPAFERYIEWLGGLFRGDLGRSLANGTEIASSIGTRLANTAFLAFWAAVFSIPLAIALGIVAARYQNRWPDKLISAVSLTAISVPEFVVGYVLMFLLAVQLNVFPSASFVNSSMTVFERLYAIALPILTLVFVVLAHMMRMTRAAILSVMESAYIETAQLKGLSPIEVVTRHALPNVVAPIINVVMLNLAYLIVGVVVIEVVFVYPGIGQYLIDHVAKRDVPVVQACGLLFAAVYIVFNMIADIAGIAANPRLRHPR